MTLRTCQIPKCSLSDKQCLKLAQDPFINLNFIISTQWTKQPTIIKRSYKGHELKISGPSRTERNEKGYIFFSSVSGLNEGNLRPRKDPN